MSVSYAMPISTPDRARIALSIAQVSLLRGRFTLRSGRTSSYYLDKYAFSTSPAVLDSVGDLLADRLDEIEKRLGNPIERLAGAELGGIPLVTVASLKTGKPCLFVRNAKKGYGTAKQLEGPLNKGDRVVFIEDVATTAGQALEAAQVLREAGLEVVAVIATIDRLEGARENVESAGLVFESLFTVRDLGIDPVAD